ncbi:MAG: photosynthetic complex assembly protein PuhC [Polaromonas sp.]|jgi:putative photosynthetic complex assembly protein
MSTPSNDNFPRWVLWSVAGLLVFTLGAVALVRITGNGPDQLAAATITERLLRFEDSAGGGVAVIDGETGQLLTTVTGEQGFFRGALRALARDRTARKIGSEQPFKLISRTDGRLTLFDPVSGQRVDLESFGPTNAAVFVPFLTMQPQANR